MSTAAPPAPPAGGDAGPGPDDRPRPVRRDAKESSSTWRLTDRIGLAICWGLGLTFCAVTVAIVGYMLVQGARYVRPGLLLSRPTAGFSQSETGGFLDPLIGTFLVSGIAIAIALPVGVAVAVWLSEYGRPSALARSVESGVEMIAGTPSIVLALFGTLLFSHPALGFLSRTTEDGVIFGRSFFAAGAMLSLVALPLIVGATREGLQAIPGHVREASYGVGKTKAATIRRILLPTARPSIITGTMLGIGRTIGDTAIIVILLGATLQMDSGDGPGGYNVLSGTGSTLTSYVYANAPTGEINQPEKAYAAAFVLLIIVLLLNVAVDVVRRRARKLS